MNRKLVFVMALTLLVGMLSVTFNVQKAKASGTIYIRADGSVDPPDAPISTFDNVTYTLTGNITSDADGIVVGRDNTVVDGAGYTLQGTGAYDSKGIDLSERENVTVRNTQIQDFSHVILLHYSSDNSISGNNITNNLYGVFLYSSSNNGISGNNITNSSVCGLGLSYYSDHNSISGNNITNNSGYGIYLSWSSNNNVDGNTVTENSWCGIELHDSSNNTVCHNNINNTFQVKSGNSANFWDDGYPSGGNYWSDYNGVDANHDGIGDTPYVIDANNMDHYPLMVPIAIPEFPSFLILLLFMIATLLAVIIYRMKHVLTVNRG